MGDCCVCCQYRGVFVEEERIYVYTRESGPRAGQLSPWRVLQDLVHSNVTEYLL